MRAFIVFLGVATLSLPALAAVGEHRITVSGHTAAGRLRVHSIPEIFDYPPCVNSAVKENGSYDWDFMKRHILPAVTTLNGGALPGPALAEARARGLKWLANFNAAPLDDPADVQTRMEKHPGLTQPQYDGFTSDELFFGRATIDNYTKALWKLRNPEHRLIYSWIVGKAYCLQFVTADCPDVVGRKFNPRRYGIAAELEGAELLPEKSFVHVDRRSGTGPESARIGIQFPDNRTRKPRSENRPLKVTSCLPPHQTMPPHLRLGSEGALPEVS